MGNKDFPVAPVSTPPDIAQIAHERQEEAQFAMNMNNNALLLLEKANAEEKGRIIGPVEAGKLLGKIAVNVDEAGKVVSYHIPLKAVIAANLREELWVRNTFRGLINAVEHKGEPMFEMPKEITMQGTTLNNPLLERLELVAGTSYEKARQRYIAFEREAGSGLSGLIKKALNFALRR